MSTRKFSKSANTLSLLGEFTDKELENEFLKEEVSNARMHIKFIMIFLGILYFLFIIPDYFIIKDPASFRIILLDRIIFLVFVVSFIPWIKKISSPYTFYVWISIYEVLAFLSFILVFSQYKSPDFLIQSFGMMVIILGIFLVPNRWIYMLLVSISINVSFYIIYLYIHDSIKTREFSAAVVYTTLVIILMGVLTFRINRYKRIQYMTSRKLMMLSNQDPLTGVYNRLKFDEELDKFISLSRRYSLNLSLIIFDCDDFKRINDEFGHLVGDKVLVETTRLIRESIRETDILARWGGDEFLILLPNTEKGHAVELAERLNTIISGHSFLPSGHITCSFGVASLMDQDDTDSLVTRADDMLYQAKGKGKNQIAG